MALIDMFWKDVDYELKIDMYNLSLLRVTMYNPLDTSKFDIAYLCKSDVIYLIDYLNSIVDEMCYMCEDI